MAGVTDRPFRALCRRMGAGMAVSEMVASDPRLRESAKTLMRTDHAGEPGPVVAQIAGADPAMLADAARFNVERGAQVIDINMGCPAKKVCNVAAGSALLRDETLVARILEAVVAAVDVPVTLKIRTGWDREHRNAPTIARIAQSAGIRALTAHPGRRLRGPGRVFHDRSRARGGLDTPHCQRRHRRAGPGASRAARDRGRRPDDRARRVRTSVDLPRDRRGAGR
jgi:nifR3 family TIM-barrel protein